mgnify:CR=1 FL=1
MHGSGGLVSNPNELLLVRLGGDGDEASLTSKTLGSYGGKPLRFRCQVGHAYSADALKQGSNIDEMMEARLGYTFMPHGLGHLLGLDVHDVGDYRLDGHHRVLEPGMALTVEPGIYIAPGSKGVAAKWQGIGVRLEDDVVVTEDGCRNLSGEWPHSADEIEAWIAQVQAR